jgi:plastocyanin
MKRIVVKLPDRCRQLLGLGLIVLSCLSTPAYTADTGIQVMKVELGDYRFTPSQLVLTAGQTVTLELTNVDKITPHTFTLQDSAAGLDIDVEVPAGTTESVTLTPATAGTYAFHCRKKLPFMKSHRTRGMEGTLVVVP